MKKLHFHKKNLIIWAIIFAAVIFVFQFALIAPDRNKPAEIAYSEFIEKVSRSAVKEVVLKGRLIKIDTHANEKLFTLSPQDPGLIDKLIAHKVKFKVEPRDQDMPIFQIILSWLPILILIGLVYLSFRNFQMGGNRAMGFGRSRAKVSGEKITKVTFEDVAGIDEAKGELQEIVDFLKNPRKFERLGGRIPRGVLLSGPPGSGKTLLARAIAGEAGVVFFAISGSDFVEMFVGVGASRVRDMFEQAKKAAPCIIFIDEIDAVGRRRNHGIAGGHEEREQTLNQLLVEMDGFEQNQGIIVIGATNRPDILDTALLRPGRFDRRISIAYPDINGREKILKVHAKNVPLDQNVDLRVIAQGTPGFSGADLANLINEAALLAARHSELSVSMKLLEDAKDKIIMGSERKSWLMSDEEKQIVAHHEAGHAVVSFYTKSTHPIHKVTIIPRGSALGMVVRLPERDQLLVSKEQFLGDIMTSMGGRIAENMFFGDKKVTAGASNDIEQATDVARKMVTQWGLFLDDKTWEFENYSRYDEAGYKKDYELSDETKIRNDAEVKKILKHCHTAAKNLLEEHKDKVQMLASALISVETLSLADVTDLFEHGKIPSKAKKVVKKPSRRLPKS